MADKKHKRETIALDSQRSRDESGHLFVARTVLSKAAVNPYFGREIPDYKALGLDPDKIYNLLRCPEALGAGSDTFKGKQLLIKHEYVDSQDVKKELVIGSVGSDLEYRDDTLYGDITVWDAQAVELIESGKMKELSASYWYRADMTSGVYKEQAYDGIMLDIRANHVALVTRGRIGRDAIISDSLPFDLEFPMLKKGTKEKISAKLTELMKRGGIANDSDIEEVVREVADNIEHKPAFDDAKLRELAGDNYDEIVKLVGGKTADDETPEEPKKADDEGEAEEPKQAEDETPAEPTAPAFDADAIAASVQAKIEAKYKARDKVEALVGRIALDGFKDAAEIYAFALKQKGIACDGVNEAGLAQMVAMASTQSKTRTVAQDAELSAPSALTERFRKA